MIPREAVQTFTGLTNEAFFLECAHKLKAKNGAQVLRIVSIDEMRLERGNDDDGWDIVLDTEDFDLSILDDGSFEDALIRGIIGVGVLDGHLEPNLDQNATFQTLDAYAQAFQLSEAARITCAEFLLQNQANPVGSLYAKLYAVTGAFGSGARPTGSALSVSEPVDVTTLPAAYGLVPFYFATPPEVGADTPRCAALEFDGNPDSVYPLIGMDVFSASHAGNKSQRNRSTGLWEGSSTQDLIFRLKGYSTPWTPPAPPSADYMLMAECTVQYLPAFGGGLTKMDFRREARVVASALNPVVL